MSKRDHISLRKKLAAALLALRDEAGAPLIPYEHAKLMTADQIISLFQFDHGILHAIEPIDEPWNLTPRLIPPHREKSAKDTSIVAHVRKVTAAEVIHKAALASKAGDYQGAARILATAPKPPRPKRRIPSRPFPKVHRKMRGRHV